jgi:hypothetical protein
LFLYLHRIFVVHRLLRSPAFEVLGSNEVRMLQKHTYINVLYFFIFLIFGKKEINSRHFGKKESRKSRHSSKKQMSLVKSDIDSSYGEVNILANAIERMKKAIMANNALHIWDVLNSFSCINIQHHKLNIWSDNAVCMAARFGSLLALDALIKHDVACGKWPTMSQLNALCIASNQGHISIVAYLVEQAGWDVNKPALDGVTAVFAAAEGGQLNVVKYLLRCANAEVDTPISNKAYDTAITIAAKRGHVEIVKYLEAEVAFRENDRVLMK